MGSRDLTEGSCDNEEKKGRGVRLQIHVSFLFLLLNFEEEY